MRNFNNNRSSIVRNFVVFLALLTTLFLFQSAIFDPKINFLIPEAGAEWITYPSNTSVGPHKAKSSDFISIEFEKSFNLPEEKIHQQTIRVRAFKFFRIWINDQELEPIQQVNWKQEHVINLSLPLEPGINTLRVEVQNKLAPPALWLCFESIEIAICTDDSWQATLAGEITLPSVIATEGATNFSLPGAPAPLLASKARSVELALVGVLIAALMSIMRFIKNRNPHSFTQIQYFQRVLAKPTAIFVFCSLMWIALFINNSGEIPFLMGFDTHGHLAYIEYIYLNNKLPLANEGWQMYQPPLYYAMTVLFLKLTGTIPGRDLSFFIVKLVPFLSGLGQIGLAWWASRIAFPDHLKRQGIAIILAACVPMNIYMSHYVSNEPLSAVLCGLAITLSIKALSQEKSSVAIYAGTGFVVGFALLTKFTALIVLCVILLSWGLKRYMSVHKRRDQPILHVAVLLGFAALVCGWFYIRNLNEFGQAIAGNWSGFSKQYWWQDPGFHTTGYYTDFGATFIHPYFSGLYSFLDGLYSTFWGDALIGGSIDWDYRPNWDYGYMSSIYILAIPASLTICVGFLSLCQTWFKNPTAQWAVVLGSIVTFVFAILYMTLEIPSYAQTKAFYGLFLITPLSLVAAVGFDTVDSWLIKLPTSIPRLVYWGISASLVYSIIRAFWI